MNFQKLICVLTISLLVSSAIYAQDIEPGFEKTEIIRLSEVYRSHPYLSYDVHYHFADSAQPTVVLEEFDISYKLQQGRYRAIMDSMDIINSYNYNLKIYHEEELIIMSNTTGYTDVLQLPLIDSLFIAANVDSLSVVNLSDSTRKLTVFFGAESPYIKYEAIYNRATSFIQYIAYYIKEPASDDPGASGVSLITAEFFNYSTAVIDEAYFNIGQFAVYADTQWQPQQAYSSYRLIDPEGREYLPAQ